MNTNRSRLFWSCTVLLLVALAVLLCAHRRSAGPLSGQTGGEAQEQLEKQQMHNPTPAPNHPPRGPSKVVPPVGPRSNTITPPQQRQISLAQAAAEKNVSVNFWGKILDQNAKPIPGVRVVMSVRRWRYDVLAGPATDHPTFEVASDAEGRFQLVGAVGDALNLDVVEKEGYRLSAKTPKGYAYGQSSSQPLLADANTPVVIRMWKELPAEPLVSCRTLFGFAPDGRSYTLDLLGGKKLTGELGEGDLVVSIERPQDVALREKYNWTVKLRAVAGGLVGPADDFMYLAPESGYQPELTVTMNASQSNWVSSITKDYYITSRNGRVFGALHLRIRPKYDNESAIFVEARMNPSGSRNLQP